MPRQSRVLVMGLNYAPEPTGIAPYTTAMTRGLASRGHTVRALTAHPHYPEWEIRPGYGQWSRREQLDGATVERLRHFVPHDPTPIPRAVSEASFGLRQVFRRWGRPDAIISVSPALLSSAITRIRSLVTHRSTPFVVWVQDLYGLGLSETGQGSGISARLIASLEAWLLRSATSVVVIHSRFADRVHADFGIARDRVHVIRNWTHLAQMPPADVPAVRAAHGWAPDETVVLHSGNMGVKQGLHHVIQAARLAEQRKARVRFVLIGNGSQRSELEALGSAEPAALQFLPPLGERDFTATLQAADVLLVNELPGVSEMAVPSKLTSYFAAGRPVLAATDSKGITAEEVFTADAGVVIPAGDPEAILAGALALAGDARLRARLGENGTRYRATVLDETYAIDQFSILLADLTSATSNSASPATRSQN